MTKAEQIRWLALLPSLVMEDNFTLSGEFPKEKMANYKAFVNSMTTMMSLLRRQRKLGESDVDVPSHVYIKRKRLVLSTEEDTNEELLRPTDLEEWQAILAKIRRGDLVSDEEETT